jgi:hypothetical protein
MKTLYLIIFILLSLIPGCSRNSGTSSADKRALINIRQQVTEVAEKYIETQLVNAKRTAMKDGTITFSNDQKKYVIEPARIFTGLIDDDQEIDALVSLSTYDTKYQTVSEQLVILKSGNEFTLACAIESDMRVISLKDRIITADVPEHSRNNPLFNCQSCWEVVRLKYDKGELVKAE